MGGQDMAKAPKQPEEGEPATAKQTPNKEKLTDALLKKELSKREPKLIWDTKQDGLCALVSRGPESKQKATISLRACYYLKSQPGKPHYLKLGRYPDGQYRYKDAKDREQIIECKDLDAVRARVATIRADARDGIDPRREVPSGSFATVVENFLTQHARRNNRTWKETQRIFEVYVLPEWGEQAIADISRDDVTLLLDRIETGKVKHKGQLIGTPTQANAVLAQLSKLFNWYATRKSNFYTPIVRGMRRGKSGKERARNRVLTETELRIIWPLLDDSYGGVVKCALLTCQRFRKVVKMRRSDLKPQHKVDSYTDETGRHIAEYFINDVWDAGRDEGPDKDPKNKGVSAVPLSAMARAVIDTVPIIDGDGDYVFSLNGDAPIKGWGRYKRRLDAALRAELGDEFRPWQFRDLRRTARTLMTRAGVPREIAERCLAHAIGGVEGVYNRHDYLREKQQAFAKLAALVDRIINQTTDNVVTLPRVGS
jgi:integrase